MERVAGWYGKMPSLGDFASRRLPRDFIDTWDAWLQESIVTSKKILGDRWLDVYLTSPLWRFALMPEVCGECAWAGVLMPSVDKTGRHFPLTLALTLEPHFDAAMSLLASQTWFADLEKVALSALDVAFLVDDLERDLAKIPFPETEPRDVLDRQKITDLALWWTSPADDPERLQLTSASSLADTLSAASKCGFAAHAAGKSIWWHETPESNVVDVHFVDRLPAHDYFAVMLTASQHGGESSVC